MKRALADDVVARDAEVTLTTHDNAEVRGTGGDPKEAACNDVLAGPHLGIERRRALGGLDLVAAPGAVQHVGNDESLTLGYSSGSAREPKHNLIHVVVTDCRRRDAGHRNAPVILALILPKSDDTSGGEKRGHGYYPHIHRYSNAEHP